MRSNNGGGKKKTDPKKKKKAANNSTGMKKLMSSPYHRKLQAHKAKKRAKAATSKAVDKELAKLSGGKPTKAQKMAKVAAKKKAQQRATSSAISSYGKRVQKKASTLSRRKKRK